MYIADGANGRVRVVGPDGRIATLIAHLNGPSGLALDGSGNLYVADSGNNRVRALAANGTISTVAGTGDAFSAGDGGPAIDAAVRPVALATDFRSALYIADGADNVVRAVAAGLSRIASGPLVWGALGGKVLCGLAADPPFRRTLLCASARVPVPRPDRFREGDPGFVFLRAAGRPRRARLSKNTWLGAGAIRCAITTSAVRCRNRARDGFTITRRSYRAF